MPGDIVGLADQFLLGKSRCLDNAESLTVDAISRSLFIAGAGNKALSRY